MIEYAEYQKHCRVLGISVGASPDVVKTAFREKIKKAHPDKAKAADADLAKTLIESYDFLKKNPVPPPMPRPESNEPPRSGAFTFGERLGRKIYEEVHGKVYEDVYGSRPNPSAGASRSNTAPSAPPKHDAFERAENALRMTVTKYNNQKDSRAKKHWALDFIRDLAEVQILYRDVARRFPEVYSPAIVRVDQIRDLVAEIKKIK